MKLRFKINLLVICIGLCLTKQVLSQADPYKGLNVKIYENTKVLESLLKTIANKSYDPKIRQDALDQAMELFIDDNVTIEVISTGMAKAKRYKIRDYLTRVYDYNYDNVKIEWKTISIIEDVKLKDDGFYYGKLRIYQVFEGTGKREYKDVTEKDLEIRLTKKFIETGNEKNPSYLELYFGNMVVQSLNGIAVDDLNKKRPKSKPKPITVNPVP